VSSLPDTMVAGQTATLTTTATWALDAATTQLAQTEFGRASYNGTIRTTPSGSNAGQDLALATTTLGSGPNGTTNASVTGSTLLHPTKTRPVATRRATGTAQVTSHFGLRPTGTVAFRLQRGTQVIKTVHSTLDRHGAARAAFPKVTRPGRYSIVVAYGRNAALTGSTGQDTFTVSR